MEKIISKEDFKTIRENLKADNKKIVLCHGVFDLIHPGHIQHFQEAKKLGDILVVSVTSEKYVRKGPGRPYFNDRLRMKSLEAIECIDYVMLSEGYTVEDIVDVVKPDIYVKGQEYKNAKEDITGKIGEEVELVRKNGGEIRYTNGEVFSSTRLINQAYPVFSNELKEWLLEFNKEFSMSDIKNCVEKMADLKVLVIGDVIIDDYVFCNVQGMMSKNMGYSAKFVKEEQYLGGSLAIASNISEFSDHVTIMSIIGNEKDIHEKISSESNGRFNTEFVTTNKFDTIIKKRYVQADDKRKELDKIFVINNLPDSMKIDNEPMLKFKELLSKEIEKYDVVFLCDFGHGLIDDEVMNIVQEKAKLLILNCQTNSSNYGLNLITKYNHADFFTLDEKELRLAFSDYKKDVKELLIELSHKLGSDGCLTRGSKGAVMISDGIQDSCPAFVLDVTDTIGAGDAFFSLAGLSYATGCPKKLSVFFGNIAGALMTNIIGNKEHLQKVNVLKYASTLLNV